MAGFRKRPAEGENPHGFRSVVPGQAGGGGISRDPTQGPPSGSMGRNDGRPRDPNGSRWGQEDRGSFDNTGTLHDW